MIFLVRTRLSLGGHRGRIDEGASSIGAWTARAAGFSSLLKQAATLAR